MGHERSRTVQTPNGWINVYGPGASSGQSGAPLPPFFSFELPTYPTELEAVHAAKKRSDTFGQLVDALVERYRLLAELMGQSIPPQMFP